MINSVQDLFSNKRVTFLVATFFFLNMFDLVGPEITILVVPVLFSPAVIFSLTESDAAELYSFHLPSSLTSPSVHPVHTD